MDVKRHLGKVTLVVGLSICVLSVVVMFPFIPRIPSWAWNRSHVPGMPTLMPPPTPLITPSYTSIVLAPDNLDRATEFAALVPPSETPGPVAALTLTPDGRVLLAAYAQEGALRHWRIDSGVLLNTFDVSPVSIAATDFDEQGQLLVTAAGRTPLNETTGYAVAIQGVRLWNARIGELLWSDDLDSKYNLDKDVSVTALSEDGQWLAAVVPSEDRSHLYVWNTVKFESSLVSLDGDLRAFFNLETASWEEQRIGETPGAIAFDGRGQMLAIADCEGRVRLRQRRQASFDSLPVDIDWAKANGYTMPLALEFDRSRRWLAVIHSGRFEMWSLGGRYIRRAFSADVPTGSASDIAFSPMSDLIAVGTSEGWEILDVNHGRRLAQGGNSPVSALTFSPDGRLFIWGDWKGTIHIWGVPQNSDE